MKKKTLRNLGLASILSGALIIGGSIAGCRVTDPHGKKMEIKRIVPEINEVEDLRSKLRDLHSQENFVSNYPALIEKREKYQKRLDNLMSLPEIIGGFKEIEGLDQQENCWYLIGGIGFSLLMGGAILIEEHSYERKLYSKKK